MDSIFIGIDECGTGAWAGPLVVCAAVFENGRSLSGLRDSKELSREKIAEWYDILVNTNSIDHVVVFKSNVQIDENGLKKALLQAWVEAGTQMQAKYPNARVILDGQVKPLETPDWLAVVDADSYIPCVMAASIIAKHHRVLKMAEYAKIHENYHFHTNDGYGTAPHQKALNLYGICDIHRRSYKPIKKVIEEGLNKINIQ
jgi:ribonuclease HII